MIITMILIFVFGYLCIALEHKNYASTRPRSPC